jgi:cell wall-active antibiotic response 4TMS protein YvqF
MPKKIFWPATLAVMGFILLSSDLNLLPATFRSLWPIILIVVGLGGLITADKENWMIADKPKKAKRKKSRKSKKK